VQFPSGGGLTITFPLQAGDTGLIVFSESSLDKWMAGDGGEVDPDFDTRMSLADGVFIPGVRARGAARDVPTGVVAIGRDGGTFQGAGLGKDITDYLGALHTAIVNHAHDWPAGSPPGSALTNPTYTGSIATLGPAPDVESSTVKITP
jgi:hypothetical protein